HHVTDLPFAVHLVCGFVLVHDDISYVVLPLLYISFFFSGHGPHRVLHSFPTRRSSDLRPDRRIFPPGAWWSSYPCRGDRNGSPRSEEHTSELQSRENLVCRLLLEKKKNKSQTRLSEHPRHHNDSSQQPLPGTPTRHQ